MHYTHAYNWFYCRAIKGSILHRLLIIRVLITGWWLHEINIYYMVCSRIRPVLLSQNISLTRSLQLLVCVIFFGRDNEICALTTHVMIQDIFICCKFPMGGLPLPLTLVWTNSMRYVSPTTMLEVVALEPLSPKKIKYEMMSTGWFKEKKIDRMCNLQPI